MEIMKKRIEDGFFFSNHNKNILYCLSLRNNPTLRLNNSALRSLLRSNKWAIEKCMHEAGEGNLSSWFISPTSNLVFHFASSNGLPERNLDQIQQEEYETEK